MMKNLFILLALIFLSACSFQTPQNQWQYKSSSAFESYKKNFLSNNDVLAKSDLNRAIKHAKQSADFTQLARIYLGVCSLNLANGVKDDCKNYKRVSNLLKSKELESYYKLISNAITQKDIEYLPQEYKEFALSLVEKDYAKANQDILNIQKTTSAFVASALIKEYLQPQTREYILTKASYHGYKKTVLFWLEENLKYTKDEEKIQQIQKKIFILKDKSLLTTPLPQ